MIYKPKFPHQLRILWWWSTSSWDCLPVAASSSLQVHCRRWPDKMSVCCCTRWQIQEQPGTKRWPRYPRNDDVSDRIRLEMFNIFGKLFNFKWIVVRCTLSCYGTEDVQQHVIQYLTCPLLVVRRPDVHENGAGSIDSYNGYQPTDPGLTNILKIESHCSLFKLNL